MAVTSDSLKNIIPLITFALGIFAVPLVEYLKDKRKAKRVKNNFSLEIEDEIKTLKKNLKNMGKALKDAKKMKIGNPEKGDIRRYAPRCTQIYFIGQVMEFSFGEFNEKQRNSIKSFFVQIEVINDYIKSIKVINIENTAIDELIDDYKRYLHTGSCMLNTMRNIINDVNLNTSENDNDIINGVFKELGIELSYEDIKIKKTTNIA
ncbi:hypothetical protein [Enterobacter ludwigii]|uniref:hypothetical protein n=1 Tax=Enterobacter ludwigii TaxID=299767 RepID=UPI0006661D19|nr:hypothetical protein [Enterobacter ludwigii]